MNPLEEKMQNIQKSLEESREAVARAHALFSGLQKENERLRDLVSEMIGVLEKYTLEIVGNK